MAKNKTSYTDIDVNAFIEDLALTEQKKNDTNQLITLFDNLTKKPPRMWGPSIIGFGNYHYKYESGHEGDAPILAFSPRKNALTLYIYSDTVVSQQLITQLGKCKVTKGCVYVQKLSDIDIEVLQQLCKETMNYLKANHQCLD